MHTSDALLNILRWTSRACCSSWYTSIVSASTCRALLFARLQSIASFSPQWYVQARGSVTRSVRTVCLTLTDHYARVGGISLIELNMLEKEFLMSIDWRLVVRTC